MALKSPLKGALKNQRGVSLIELVVAMSLSALVVGMSMALYKDVASAARLLVGARDDAAEARIAFNSLCDNLLEGRGVLFLGEHRVKVINAAGIPMEYSWEDSTLTVNGKPWRFRVASMEVTPWGPDLPPEEEWTRERMEYADLDSLDDDRDRVIDFDELDRDRSGELDPMETRYIALLKVSLSTVNEGVVSTLSGSVHPRNHAREWAEDALDALPGVGDFGR